MYFSLSSFLSNLPLSAHLIEVLICLYIFVPFRSFTCLSIVYPSIYHNKKSIRLFILTKSLSIYLSKQKDICSFFKYLVQWSFVSAYIFIFISASCIFTYHSTSTYVYWSISVSFYVSSFLPFHLSTKLSTRLSIVFVFSSFYLFVYLSIYPVSCPLTSYLYLSIGLPIHLHMNNQSSFTVLIKR